MSDLRKAIAEVINESSSLGCGCCSYYDATEEQQQAANVYEVNWSSIVLADEILAVIPSA